MRNEYPLLSVVVLCSPTADNICSDLPPVCSLNTANISVLTSATTTSEAAQDTLINVTLPADFGNVSITLSADQPASLIMNRALI